MGMCCGGCCACAATPMVFPLDDETLVAQFRLHLHRGLGYLVGDPRVTDIAGLLSMVLDGEPELHAGGGRP